eukprot:11230691-Karenia_brevis.AAC.1
MVPDVAVGQELGPLRPVRRVTCREGGPSHVAKSQGPRHRNVNKQMPATPLKVQHHDVRPVVGGIEGSAIRILGPDVRVGENRPNHGEHHRQEDSVQIQIPILILLAPHAGKVVSPRGIQRLPTATTRPPGRNKRLRGK